MTDDQAQQRIEARRLAASMRRVIEHLVATKAPASLLHEAATELEAIASSLESHPRGHTFEGFGGGSFAESATSGNPHAFFDHSPLIGAANPLAPPLQLEPADGQVIGRARFGSAYEGPPGCVHGGFIAAAFDEVLGMAQSMSGNPGMTGTLTIRYRRPTPLHADLTFEAAIERIEGRKIFTRGRLLHGDDVTAEAEAVFISVDFAAMARLSGQQATAESSE